jgi:DNA-binding response OmpR family regulator
MRSTGCATAAASKPPAVQRFDALLLDLTLPDADGQQLLRDMRCGATRHRCS